MTQLNNDAQHRATFMVRNTTEAQLRQALGEEADISMIVVGDNGICAWENNTAHVMELIAKELPSQDQARLRSADNLTRAEKETLLSIFAAGNHAWGTSPDHQWRINTREHPIDVLDMLDQVPELTPILFQTYTTTDQPNREILAKNPVVRQVHADSNLLDQQEMDFGNVVGWPVYQGTVQDADGHTYRTPLFERAGQASKAIDLIVERYINRSEP